MSLSGPVCTFAFIMAVGALCLYGLDNIVLKSLCSFHEQSCILGSFGKKKYDEVLGV